MTKRKKKKKIIILWLIMKLTFSQFSGLIFFLLNFVSDIPLKKGDTDETVTLYQLLIYNTVRELSYKICVDSMTEIIWSLKTVQFSSY